jgi:hypothetical protein
MHFVKKHPGSRKANRRVNVCSLGKTAGQRAKGGQREQGISVLVVAVVGFVVLVAILRQIIQR